MKSFGTRLAFWYAAAATVTLACASLAGYFLLRSYLIEGLDVLIKSEFEQIRDRLGPDVATLAPPEIEARIRDTTEAASVLFYLDVHHRDTGTIFYSRNLRGEPIPDVKGLDHYDVDFSGFGRLRVGEFELPPFDVIVATPESQLDEVMEDYTEVLGAITMVMLAVSVVIGIGLSRYALRPVGLISETASRISSDNLGDRIPVPAGRDEMSALAELLNAMFDRLQASFQNVRRFAGDASHELKTPLSLVRLLAEKVLASGRLDPQNEEQVQSILEEIGRLNATIDDLLFLSRAEARAIQLRMTKQDPVVTLQSFGADALVLAEHRNLQFTWHHEGVGQLEFEPRYIRRVLLNLLSNAIDASPAAATIRLQSRISVAEWEVSLSDEGPGVPLEERQHIFDRFVRLSGPSATEQSGTGLGLAICRSIVEIHGGKIQATTAGPGGGLCVTFTLPINPAPDGHHAS